MKPSTDAAQAPWPSLLWRRRASVAPLPRKDQLPLPERDTIDEGAAKAALEQVHKRQDALLAAKTSTENRALTLAGHCLTALVAVTGAGFWAAGQSRWDILAATVAGGACLFIAVLCALNVIRPRDDLTLPGRLPDELWRSLTVQPGVNAADFILLYLRNAQDSMVRNEIAQRERADGLHATVRAAALAVPAAVAIGGLAAILFR